MESILLETDDKIAKNWRYSSEKKRKEVNSEISKVLEMVFSSEADEANLNETCRNYYGVVQGLDQ